VCSRTATNSKRFDRSAGPPRGRGALGRAVWAAASVALIAACAGDPAAPPEAAPPVWFPGGARALAPGLDPTPTTGDVYVVQLDGPIVESTKAGLRAAGAELLEYVPRFAYLARIHAEDRARVAAAPHVRAVGPFLPRDRRPPSLAKARLGADPAGLVRVRAVLFDDVDPARLAPFVAGVGGTTRESVWSAWISFVDLALPPGAIDALAARPEVRRLEEPARFRVSNVETRPTIQSGSYASGSPFTAEGLDGRGQIVAMMDTGLDLDHGMFAQSATEIGTPGPTHRKVLSYLGYGGGDTTPCSPGDHGTHVAGTLLGNAAEIGLDGRADGIAPAARLIAQDIVFGCDGHILPPSDLSVPLMDAREAGAFIHTNSWGGGFNAYTSASEAIDAFMWSYKDFLVLVAAGNDGGALATVSMPATAKNVVTVGAHDADPNFDQMADFSSRGPAVPLGSGRRKPTLVAPGEDTAGSAGTAAHSLGILSAESDVDTAIGAPLASKSGTSMATPAVAGAAALARQYFMEGRYPTGAPSPEDALTPSAALLRGVLMNAARNMSGATPRPSNDQGMGRLVLDDALARCSEPRRLFVDDGSRLGTDEARVYRVTTDGAEPLQITLTWTDREGDFLVNDLDLTVEHDGTTWLGGVFTDGWSTTGGAVDRTNPDEAVFLSAPAPGVYTVTVRGFNVPEGEDDAKQPFALVVSGTIADVDGTPFAQTPGAIGALAPFDSIRSGNPRPTLGFAATSPDGLDLTYEIEWSADPTFATSTRRTAGPFASGAPGSYTLAAGEALTEGTWYWRVRAQAAERSCFTAWSERRSYTYEAGRAAPGWYQGAAAQLEEGAHVDTEVTPSGVTLAFTGGANLALGAVASASSFLGSPYSPPNVNDGDPETAWLSATELPAWIEVDLGAVRSLDRAQVDFSETLAPLTSAADFELQLSEDGASFTAAQSFTDAAEWSYSVNFEPRARARFVRVLVTRDRGDTHAASVAELRAFEALATGTMTSAPFVAADANAVAWRALAFAGDVPADGALALRLEHRTAPDTWALVDDADLPGNAAGFDESPVDLSGLDLAAYPALRAVATITAGAGASPALTSIAFEVDPGEDTAPPVLVAHDVTAEATSAAGAEVAYDPPEALDDRDAPIEAACVPAPGSAFPLGATTVTCDATDAAGNAAATAHFLVRVVDTTPPLIDAASLDRTVEATGPDGVTATFAGLSAVDAVSGAVSLVCAPPAGMLFPLGATEVICSAADGAGNASEAAFTLTVRDTTPPVIAPHRDLIVLTPGGAAAPVAYVAPATSDAVDGAGAASCLPASGGAFPLGSTVVTCSATDAAGNAAAPTTFAVLVRKDTDGDGLADDDELAAGTDPHAADSDGDGLADGLEVDVTRTDPRSDDTDDDGLPDAREDRDADGEVDRDETSATEADTDGDGLQDGTELGLVAPEADDTDLERFVADADPETTTDPTHEDSDGDGLVDGAEDADHDGAVGDTETDPNLADTDGGGVDDGAEIERGTDPLDPADDDGSSGGAKSGGCSVPHGGAGQGGSSLGALLLGLFATAGLRRRGARRSRR
jgi:hypothetical protein